MSNGFSKTYNFVSEAERVLKLWEEGEYFKKLQEKNKGGG